MPSLNGQKERATDSGRIEYGDARGTRINIFDERCTDRCPIGLPQLSARGSSGGSKVEDSVGCHKVSGGTRAATWVKIAHQNRACSSSIALPQLVTHRTIVGSKEQSSIEIEEVFWDRRPSCSAKFVYWDCTDVVPSLFQSSKPLVMSLHGKTASR